MKKLWLILLLAPVICWAQSPFDGTWRVDLNKAQFSPKPDTFVVQNGNYTCSTCVPPIEVKADGQDHKVTGHPRFDTFNVRVVDAKTIEETGKKNGKVAGTAKSTLSDDGNRLTVDFTEHPEASKQPVTGKVVLARVSKGPAGSHACSGSWRMDKVANVSQNGLTVTLKGTDNGLSFTSPTGESYDAKFDGKDYPFKGNPGITSVSLKKVDANTVEETLKRDGKVISINRLTVAPDGKSLKIDANDKLRDTTSSFVAEKQ